MSFYILQKSSQNETNTKQNGYKTETSITVDEELRVEMENYHN